MPEKAKALSAAADHCPAYLSQNRKEVIIMLEAIQTFLEEHDIVCFIDKRNYLIIDLADSEGKLLFTEKALIDLVQSVLPPYIGIRLSQCYRVIGGEMHIENGMYRIVPYPIGISITVLVEKTQDECLGTKS